MRRARRTGAGDDGSLAILQPSAAAVRRRLHREGAPGGLEAALGGRITRLLLSAESRLLINARLGTSSLNRYPMPWTVSMYLDRWGSSPSFCRAADVDVEGAGAAGELVAPHLFEQRLPIDGFARRIIKRVRRSNSLGVSSISRSPTWTRCRFRSM